MPRKPTDPTAATTTETTNAQANYSDETQPLATPNATATAAHACPGAAANQVAIQTRKTSLIQKWQ